MKPTIFMPLLTKLLLTSCLLSASFGLAQPLLTSYEDATAALRSSIAAFPSDQVESLDALRQAEIAFEPLGALLKPTLRSGLNATFSRAEEAIVNQSETDLQVQSAVLQGGFGRAVYQQALQNAANGDLESARNFLNVLGRDLGFADAQFSGLAQAALQGAFEARLAARGLAQLGTFGGNLEDRYRTLAQLYSYIFLVQDSPRLPPKTQDTVIGTIRALVAERPIDEGISLLRAQLTGFARRAERAEAEAVAQTDSAGAGDNSGDSAKDGAGDGAGNGNGETAARTQAQPDPATAPNQTTGSDASENGSGAAPFVPPVTTLDDALTDGNTQPTFPNPATSSGQTEPVQTDVTEPGVAPALPFLTPDVRDLLFIAAGLLALVGLVRLLFAPNTSPWQDAALALLLLPAVAQGFVALADLLAPLVDQPQLAQAGSYSLFVNPVMQLVWVSLTVAAVLCLAIGWRTAGHAAERITDHQSEADKTTPPERDRSAAGQAPGYAPRSAPLATGTLDWDEDF